MEIQTSLVSQNYQTNLKKANSTNVEDTFKNIIGEDGTLNISFDESELRNLSYEEAKALRVKLEESGHLQATDANGNQLATFGSSLLQVTNLTNDDSFNKAMFETMKNSEEPGLMLMELKHNMEYSQGKRAHPWPTLSLDEVQGNMTQLTPEEFRNIDVKKFLDEIIKTYEELLLNLPHYLDKNETEETLNGYKELKEKYQKELDEKSAILESYTKNNKENPFINKE